MFLCFEILLVLERYFVRYDDCFSFGRLWKLERCFFFGNVYNFRKDDFQVDKYFWKVFGIIRKVIWGQRLKQGMKVDLLFRNVIQKDVGCFKYYGFVLNYFSFEK